MFCPECGAENSDSAKYCSKCGQPFAVPSDRCACCGAKLTPGAAYCIECGSKVQPADKPRVPERPRTAGQLLYPAKQFSMYEGEPTVGFAKATGPLTVYDDRIEFKKILGSSPLSTLSLALSKKDSGGDRLLVIPVSQIARLRVGSYGGIYKTLVVIQRDNTVLSFAPVAPGSSIPQNIIDVLQPYLS